MGDQTAKIRRQVPEGCQILLFSATYPQSVREYAKKMVPNANTISLKASHRYYRRAVAAACLRRPARYFVSAISLQREELALNNIQQFFVHCRDEADKYAFLSKIYGLLTIGSSIIFCNVRARLAAPRQEDVPCSSRPSCHAIVLVRCHHTTAQGDMHAPGAAHAE